MTSTVAGHANCSLNGPPQGPGVAELRLAADAIVKANPKITAEAIKKTIKFQTGVDVHPRTANRLKHVNLDVSADTRAQGFQRLGSYLDKLAELSNGTVTDVKVSYFQYVLLSAWVVLDIMQVNHEIIASVSRAILIPGQGTLHPAVVPQSKRCIALLSRLPV